MRKVIYIFGKGVPYGVANSLLSLSCIRRGGSSMTHFGIPLFVGAPRCHWLQPIADKIKSRISSWTGLSLSFMCRVCLINSVVI